MTARSWVSAWVAVLLGAWLAVASGGTAVAGPRRGDSGTTTTTLATSAASVAGPTTAGSTIPPAAGAPETATSTTATSTTTASTTTTSTIVAPTTVAPTTTTTLDPARLAALIHGLDADVARAQAVSDFLAARDLAAQLGAGQSLPANADPILVQAAATQLQATATLAAAQRRFDAARHRVAMVAVALYEGDQMAPPPPDNSLDNEFAVRSVYLSDIVDGTQQQAKQADQALVRADAAFKQSQEQAERLVQAQSIELQADLQTASVGSVTTGASGAAASTQSLLDQESPTILGPSVLSAGELVGWFQASGHRAQLTVPLATLAAAYESIGAADGVRADLAFAQSVIETGYFSFPSFGQVAVADNNFAGIGACNSCTTGLHFPDAVTGVTAQMQLLHAYATTAQPVPGPLPGPFGVAGCCPTWMDLSGVWATATDYGIDILKVYQSMVEWALAGRTAAARL